MSETNNINIQLIKPLVREFPLSGNHISAFSCISIEEYPIHSHLHMEVIYVVKGSLRVSEAEEAQGLDVAAHGESAYPAYVGLD